MWGLCRRLTPDPEDAYQEVWARVVAALPAFDPAGPASFGTWVTTIAHRHLVDRHRRRLVRGEVVPMVDVPEDRVDPGEDLDRARAVARLDAALARLPVDQRRVILLHHLHGRPLDGIARDEGVALGTVKSRLHRARALLARLLGGADG